MQVIFMAQDLAGGEGGAESQVERSKLYKHRKGREHTENGINVIFVGRID